jgi:glycogen operon protein
MSEAKLEPGRPFPLGATWDGEGTNFAVYSSSAEHVDLCLFDKADDAEAKSTWRLPKRSGHIWHGYLRGCQPGALYGLRVDGPYTPEQGLKFNANKLLLDPYARAIVGEVKWSSAHYAYDQQDSDCDLSFNSEDSAGAMPKSMVVDGRFDWGDDKPPRVPWRDMVIYELHVKGFTQRHPDVPEKLRGTYEGLATPAAIAHFKKLGVTSLELLPIHAFVDDHRLVELGKRNYWGYNTIGFFAPEMRYSATGSIDEFKRMVKALHEAGLEVILDVVYNHTAEGNHMGPTLCFKGIDNPSYYRLAADPRYYSDVTGTGNTVNTHHPMALKLIMDSLRYWVQEMHVDGFRFDLASALGRGKSEFDIRSSFFAAIIQDPVLSHVKLIAEPWDTGEGGYRVGGYPTGWAEWNGRYRDDVRSFWRGDEGALPAFAKRLSGSADLYQHSGRRPVDSINIVTVHDGFTLRDLVSYNDKHNEANGESNRDGESHNSSWNCGVEGETEDEAINTLRARQQRNFLATLFLSQGTPLLLGGDELGRTQKGNNNAYCQDSALSWLDWHIPMAEQLQGFVQKVIALRKSLPALRRTNFLTGIPSVDGKKDLTWFNAAGLEMKQEEWLNPAARSACAVWCGRQTGELDEDGKPLHSDTVLIMFNAYHDKLKFVLPPYHGKQWTAQLDTAQTDGRPAKDQWHAGERYPVAGRSLVLMTQSPT